MTDPMMHQTDDGFTEQQLEGLYKAIYTRRDVRGQFKPDPIPADVLGRILDAAHHAPSVGFMQPWNFMLIRSEAVKRGVQTLFARANEEAAQMFESEKARLYQQLKLEGIMASPLNICITCDSEKAGPVVLGRTHDKAMDLYSTVCAVQNLMLAARAEGVGTGWVSIFDKDELKKLLNLPEHVTPVAYLCLGYVDFFYQKPELESVGWRKRLAVEEQVMFDRWDNLESDNEENHALLDELIRRSESE